MLLALARRNSILTYFTLEKEKKKKVTTTAEGFLSGIWG